MDDLTAQTLFQKGELEIIVIDSGSKENEEKIVRSFQCKHRNIHYLRTPKRESLYAAWNRGIEKANGIYLCNANTDDRHSVDCLEKLSSALDHDKNTSLAYGELLQVHYQNDRVVKKRCPSQEFFPGSLFLHYPYGAQPMWRASIHDKIGLFDPIWEVIGDYEFGLRMIKNGFKSKYIPEAKGTMLWHPNALSNHSKQVYQERKSLQRSIRKTEVILESYRHYFFQHDLEIPDDFQNQCMLDLGLRSLCFFPQFSGGKSTFDTEMMKLAYFSNFESPQLLNNQILWKIITGCTSELNLLDQKDYLESEIFYHNQETLAKGLEANEFLLFGPKIDFPTEMKLRKTSSVYLTKQDSKANSYSIFRFNFQKFKSEYLKGFDVYSLKDAKTIFIWGLNAKSKLLLACLKGKYQKKIQLLDSSRVSKSLGELKIQDPNSVFENKEIDQAVFILCMNSIHWPLIERKIKLECPKSKIVGIHR